MAYSKVILNGTTLMDVTQDTVDAANLLSGETATKNSGAKVTGTYTPPTFSTQSKTVTPTTTNQTIASGQYLTGAQTILGDQNLLAENIKKDVSIFGVTGTLEGGGTVQTRKIYDETYVGWGHVSWLDATGIARTGAIMDDELNIEYIEPQIGSLVSRLVAITPMANQNLQVVDVQTITETRPPVTYYSYVWIVT